MRIMSEWYTAFAPATVANVGPGFDILGLSLDPSSSLGDTCHVRLAPPGQFHLTIDGDNGRLPRDPEQNVASFVARYILNQVGVHHGLDIRLEKGLPIGSGLGSSAASAASAALATNAALGMPLTLEQLVPAGQAGEALAAGSPHPDNVVPALLGGLLLMVEEPGSDLRIVRLPAPSWLRVVVVMPQLEVRTADARAVMPEKVPMSNAIRNMASIGLLVSGLYEGDAERVGAGIRDCLHQPYRASLVPGFVEARKSALSAGALGVGLSGSGPAVFAFCLDEQINAVGEALVHGFSTQGVEAVWHASRIAQARNPR